MSLAPDVGAVRGRMLRVADSAFTGLPVWAHHVAAVPLLPGAKVLRAAALLAVEGAADLLPLAVVLRHLDALVEALACSFASLLALA